MGNDGGSIPKRIELVKEKQKEVRPDQNALKVAMWFFCALSKRPLQAPVVACALGKLYNKDAILEYLLNKSAYGDGDVICSHITSIKDVKTLNLTPNPAFKESSASVAHFEQGMVSKFICPISMKEMNGKLKFVYLDTCGCVFSEQTLKEVPSEACIQVALEKIATSSTGSNKRKNDDGHDSSSQSSKKLAIDSQINGSNSSAPSKAKQSKAIQSIYSKKGDCKVTDSYLVRGTFNRYAA
ncbi:38057_t:CDS:2 [Gigaspora margarita]|uniref:38057_t:CDS:1 n=1 Tax=Gigaspora margarita TaxID=4874 RepID=A0ABM8W3A2_GIGMA|nr:38057_t:CDS:2 [Gigaspora margarita]